MSKSYFYQMKILSIVLALILFSCGGSLSREQRKKIRSNMEAKSIKKISDAELTEAALSYARGITKIVEESRRSDRVFLDSLNKAYDVEIIFMNLNDSNLRAVERQVMEAYRNSNDAINPGDNLQRMGRDSLLYTKPILTEGSNRAPQFTKALALRIPKKAVILSITNYSK